jgi:signal recognition particle GTPase
MVFDFIRNRAAEGLAQVKNIAEKTLEGKLGEAFEDSVQYIRSRQQIDADNLKKMMGGLASSRDRILDGISGAFREADLSIEKRLEMLEETLLRADIGYSTASMIIDDLRSYAK